MGELSREKCREAKVGLEHGKCSEVRSGQNRRWASADWSGEHSSILETSWRREGKGKRGDVGVGKALRRVFLEKG